MDKIREYTRGIMSSAGSLNRTASYDFVSAAPNNISLTVTLTERYGVVMMQIETFFGSYVSGPIVFSIDQLALDGWYITRTGRSAFSVDLHDVYGGDYHPFAVEITGSNIRYNPVHVTPRSSFIGYKTVVTVDLGV